MANTGLKIGIAISAALAVFFQLCMKEMFWLGFGIGRTIQPISDFPYTCRRIVDPRLQACEDMWLSESTRQLFLACSDGAARKHWVPALGHLNAAARPKDDAMIAMDIDVPSGESFAYRVLSMPGFTGTAGDGRPNLVGFQGLELSPSSSSTTTATTGDEGTSGDGGGSSSKNGRIAIALVNHRPSVDPATGELLDNYRTGANSTIEIFETDGPRATKLRHVRTVADGLIATPNRVVFAGEDVDDGFYITNDHGQHKVGIRHQLASLVRGTGDVTYCAGREGGSGCKVVAEGFRFPNGLLRSRLDGLLYVPTSASGEVFVYRPQGDGSLEQVGHVRLGYTIDNLSEDAEGDFYAAVFPVGLEPMLMSRRDPMKHWPRSGVFRIWKKKAGEAAAANAAAAEGEGGVVGREELEFGFEKVLEDNEKEVLPGATTAVHDAKTGRLFLAGVASPFIAVCDPK